MQIVKSTQQSALLLQQPKKFYAELPAKTLNDIARSNTPSLAVLNRDFGKNVCKAVVIIALDDLIEFYNVKLSFTDAQINQTADLIIENFYWFKVDDFKLCFNRAKTGYYGAAYNRLDGSVIFEWLNRYADERSQHFATKAEQEKFDLPAIKNAPDVKSMHNLYDQFLKNQQTENERLQRREKLKEEGRKKAIEAWHREYNEHFAGVEITEQLHEEYLAKNPLNESYIKFFINKHVAENEGPDVIS